MQSPSRVGLLRLPTLPVTSFTCPFLFHAILLPSPVSGQPLMRMMQRGHGLRASHRRTTAALGEVHLPQHTCAHCTADHVTANTAIE